MFTLYGGIVQIKPYFKKLMKLNNSSTKKTTLGSDIKFLKDPYITKVSDNHHTYEFICHSVKEENRARRLLEKEKGTIAWLEKDLKSDDVFYDIGANIGSYTIFAGYRLGSKGKVIAFEPHIPNANSLIENIIHNSLQDKVQIVTTALTDKNGYKLFNYHSMYAGASTSQYGRNSYEGESFISQFVEIKHGCTIDTLLEHKLIPSPNLVKIDVDGLDYEVLAGMQKIMMSSCPPRAIQIELGSDSKKNILNLFAKTGYLLQEKHWTTAGLEHIRQGNNPEDYPHYGIFYNHKFLN